MALVVEDGTGKSDAESYISLADATTRHSNLGNSAWAAAADDPTREAALRRATNYMEQAYRERWAGFRNHKNQGLSWPRFAVLVDGYPIDTTVVPPEVANACADLALKALSADLNADLTTRVVAETVGQISTEYSPNSPQSVRYPAIDQMLAPFLDGQGASKLVRA